MIELLKDVGCRAVGLAEQRSVWNLPMIHRVDGRVADGDITRESVAAIATFAATDFAF
jgi:hypothetical protein